MGRRGTLLIATALIAVAVAGCSDDGTTSAPTSPPFGATAADAAPGSGLPTVDSGTGPSRSDGVLRIGLMRPTDSANADIAASVSTGVELAVSDLRAAGQAIELIRGAEAEAALTQASLTEIIASGASAIVGPMSSNAALAALAVPVNAGVPSCSPTATSLALDQFPDRGLFVRTVPSDSLQAKAIAQIVDRTGATTVAIAYLDDNFGQPLADAVEDYLRAANATITGYPFTTDEASITEVADRLGAQPPGAIVVLGSAASTVALVNAAIAKLPGSGANQPLFVVNDTARRAFAALDASARTVEIVGVSPQATQTDSAFDRRFRAVAPSLSGSFAKNAYDCVMLIALAAAHRGSTAPVEIGSALVDVASGGSACAGFIACRALLAAGRNIDYGELDLDSSGELSEATFDRFRIDQRGVDQPDGTVTVRR